MEVDGGRLRPQPQRQPQQVRALGEATPLPSFVCCCAGWSLADAGSLWVDALPPSSWRLLPCWWVIPARPRHWLFVMQASRDELEELSVSEAPACCFLPFAACSSRLATASSGQPAALKAH